jgi:uncharacterized membrane protein
MNNDVFKSKRFWSAVVGLVFLVAGAFHPEVEVNAEMFQEALLVIVGLLIGGYALEDAAAALKSGKRADKYDLKKE